MFYFLLILMVAAEVSWNQWIEDAGNMDIKYLNDLEITRMNAKRFND